MLLNFLKTPAKDFFDKIAYVKMIDKRSLLAREVPNTTILNTHIPDRKIGVRKRCNLYRGCIKERIKNKINALNIQRQLRIRCELFKHLLTVVNKCLLTNSLQEVDSFTAPSNYNP